MRESETMTAPEVPAEPAAEKTRDTGKKRLDIVQLTGVTYFLFDCLACGCQHVFEVRSDGGHPTWHFDGNMDEPTFGPVLKNHVRGCHLSVESGVIHYLPSSVHEYRGMRVRLPALSSDE